MKRKPYLKITTPIQFVNLIKAGGWYYRKAHNRGPLIQVSADQELFHKIRLLFHEFVHEIVDYLPEIAGVHLKKDIKLIDENAKVIAMDNLEDKREEQLAEDIGVFAKEAFYEAFLYKSKKKKKKK